MSTKRAVKYLEDEYPGIAEQVKKITKSFKLKARLKWKIEQIRIKFDEDFLIARALFCFGPILRDVEKNAFKNKDKPEEHTIAVYSKNHKFDKNYKVNYFIKVVHFENDVFKVYKTWDVGPDTWYKYVTLDYFKPMYKVLKSQSWKA